MGRAARVTSPSVIPVILAGFCAFVTLFAPQPILPLLADVFHAGKATISLAITASTLGVALAAPVIGRLADAIGRKRVIVLSAAVLAVATLLTATSTGLATLLFWRFVQGVATPGVFSVTTAYIHDEWSPARAASAISAYVSGTVIGGFSGRVIVGFAARIWGWQGSFLALGFVSLSIAIYLAAFLPRESGFERPTAQAGALAAASRHLGNRQLLAAYSVGFCVLFSSAAMSTYVPFHLAAPPFLLGPGPLGMIFAVYLVGAIVTPLAGRRIDKDGHGVMLMRAAALGISGALLALVPNLWAVIGGLAVTSTALFIAQASATSFVGVAAKENRALALGLYVTFYYAGGSFGGAAPGWLWQAFGWPGCIVLVVSVEMVIAAVAWKLRATREQNT